MASGKIKGSFTGTSTANVYPEIRWRSTSDISGNKSTVTAELWFVKVNSYWTPYNLSGYSCTININGNSATATRTIDLRSAWSQKIWERTVTVAHNSDGNKSITISSSGGTGLNLGSVSVSGTAKLDTIPRASSLTMSTKSAVLGETDIVFTINKANSAFKHDLYWSWVRDEFNDGKWDYIPNGYQTKSAKITSKIPVAKFLPLMPNTASTFIYIYLDTFNGNSRIGRKVYQLDISLSASIKPTVGRLTTEELVIKTKEVMGTSGTAVKHFVQSNSNVQIGVYDVKMAEGSYLKKYRYYSKIGSNTEEYWGENTTGWYKYHFTQYRDYSGDIELIAYAYDTRNRYSRTSVTVTIHPYTVPTINLISAIRVGTEQTAVKFKYTGSIKSINVGGVEKNKGTTQIQTIVTSLDSSVPSNWWKSGLYTVLSQEKDIANFDISKSYKVWVGINDAFGNGSGAYGMISTAYTIMDLHRDNGVGFGKLHEQGTIDVAKTIYLEGNKISIHNKLLRLNNEDIVGYGQNSNGEYVYFNDGTMICWKNYVEATSACNVAYGSLFSTRAQLWTFPSQFYDYPAVSVHIVGGGAYTWGAHGAGGVTRINAPWIAYGAVSVSTKPQGSLIAIGRWKV